MMRQRHPDSMKVQISPGYYRFNTQIKVLLEAKEQDPAQADRSNTSSSPSQVLPSDAASQDKPKR